MRPLAMNRANPFADVHQDDYYYDAVLWAVENGITTGVNDTTFAPNAICRRSDIAVFLWRMDGCPEAEGRNPFVDVPADSYYADAVCWAVEAGITRGTTEETFDPQINCSRGQIVTFLYRYNQK